MTRTESDRLARLEKRAAHLAQRIQAADLEGKDLAYDKGELSALRWAIDFIRGALDVGNDNNEGHQPTAQHPEAKDQAPV